MVATANSDRNRVTSMSCLQKVVHKIEHKHEKTCQSVYVWSDGHNLDLAIYLDF